MFTFKNIYSTYLSTDKINSLQRRLAMRTLFVNVHISDNDTSVKNSVGYWLSISGEIRAVIRQHQLPVVLAHVPVVV